MWEGPEWRGQRPPLAEMNLSESGVWILARMFPVGRLRITES
jgi:hypothetical protein